jgi:hypothetical protein
MRAAMRRDVSNGRAKMNREAAIMTLANPSKIHDKEIGLVVIGYWPLARD